MLARVNIVDWEPGGTKHSAELRLVSETMSLREFIHRRLVAEEEAIEAADGDPAKYPDYERWKHRLAAWFVVSGEVEQALNGKKRVFAPLPGETGSPHRPGVDTQIARVEKAFARRGFVVIFDGVQVEDLDQRVTVRDDSSVSFIRLLPLIGG